jgi:transposase
MPVVAGADCHRDTHTIVVIDGVGKVLSSFSIPASAEGYRLAISEARKLAVESWGLEGTGAYGRAFAQALLQASFTVFEVPGIMTKRHRKHASRHGKSDELDARAIGEVVLRESDRLPRFREFAEQEALRLRYDQRDRLVRERTMVINRLRSAALRLALPGIPSDLTSDSSVDKLRETALPFRADGLVEDVIADEIRFGIETLQRLNAEIRRLEHLIGPFVKRLAPELLELRGVSLVTAAGLVGHTGDVANLRNADAFAMRSAAAPVPWSSGRNQSVRLNTGGDRQLNRLLHTIALTQIRSVGHQGRQYYQRKLAAGMTPRSAIRALKRHLATVVFYRLRLCQNRVEAGMLVAAA